MCLKAPEKRTHKPETLGIPASLLQNMQNKNKTYSNRRASLPTNPVFDCIVFVRIFTRPFQRPIIRFHKPIPATQNMTHRILTEIAASISELKANPMKVVSSGNGMPIAVLNRNEPAFYCVPAAAYEALMELIDDAELLKLVKERVNEPAVRVTLDDL